MLSDFIDFGNIFQKNIEQCNHELLELKSLTKESELSDNEQADIAYKQFLLSVKAEKYEAAIIYIDNDLEYKKLYNQVPWDKNKTLTLEKLELIQLC